MGNHYLCTEIYAIIRYKSMQEKNDKNIKTTILDEIVTFPENG